jgi:hypothetical protein
MTALPGAERLKELSSFTPSCRFRNSVLPSEFHTCLRMRVYSQGSVNVSNVRLGSFSRRVGRFCLYFISLGTPKRSAQTFAFVAE